MNNQFSMDYTYDVNLDIDFIEVSYSDQNIFRMYKKSGVPRIVFADLIRLNSCGISMDFSLSDFESILHKAKMECEALGTDNQSEGTTGKPQPPPSPPK